VAITRSVRDRFPDGTVVRAFLARAHPPTLTKVARGVTIPPPDASSVDVGTVANGQVTFNALTAGPVWNPGELYWVAGSVGGSYRQLAFPALAA
jgi:hypothetical protein